MFDNDAAGGQNLDWETRTRAWLKVVASSSTDIGRAAAVIGLRQVDEWRTRNVGQSNLVGVPPVPSAVVGGDHTNGVRIDEAYVSIGDATVLNIGLRRVGIGNGGSVANSGDDAPYSYLFMSDKIDGGGILIDNDDRRFGGTSIQVQTDLGNGFNAAVGLENMANEQGAAFADPAGLIPVGNDSTLAQFRSRPDRAGTLIGVLQYQGDGLTAHVTGVAHGVMDAAVDAFAVHAGVTGTFDMITVRAAAGYDSNFKYLGYSVATALASAKATFDMFTIAVSGEVANYAGGTDVGAGANVAFAVSDGVSINVDGAWFHRDAHGAPFGNAASDHYRLAAGVSAAVTETITLTGSVGGYFGATQGMFGKAGVAWAPGGGTTAGASIEVHDNGGYRGEVTAGKTF